MVCLWTASGSSRQATGAGSRVQRMSSSASSLRSWRSGLVAWGSRRVAQTAWRVALCDPPAQVGARLGVLRRDLAELSGGHREIHGPAETEDLLREDLIGVRCPVRLAQAIQCRDPEVVRNDAGDLAVPGARFRRLAELLIDRGGEGRPRKSPYELHEFLH